MLNNNQIKLVQVAIRSAGLRTKYCDGRYRLLLARYCQPNGSSVKSCKQLNNWQLDDLLAICESLGWRYPNKSDDYYRQKVRDNQLTDGLSMAQLNAIGFLSGDLGWDEIHLNYFLKKMTGQDAAVKLSKMQAFGVIEALKAMYGRKEGKDYKNLKEIQKDTEVSNGQKSKIA